MFKHCSEAAAKTQWTTLKPRFPPPDMDICSVSEPVEFSLAPRVDSALPAQCDRELRSAVQLEGRMRVKVSKCDVYLCPRTVVAAILYDVGTDLDNLHSVQRLYVLGYVAAFVPTSTQLTKVTVTPE